MSVEHVKGNILDFPNNSNVLAHGVSLQGKYGAGLAKQIAEEYPAAKNIYMEAFETKQLRLGTMTVADVAGGKKIANLVVQEQVGTDKRQLDYEALYVALSDLEWALRHAKEEGRIYRLALTWIGCGLAGGSLKIVGAMIEDIFGNSPIVCTVVGYVQPPKKKIEPEAVVQSDQPSTTTVS